MNITDVRSVSRRRATNCQQLLKRVQKPQRQRGHGRPLADDTFTSGPAPISPRLHCPGLPRMPVCSTFWAQAPGGTWLIADR